MLDQDSKRVCSQCLRNDEELYRIIVNDTDSHLSCDYCQSDEPTLSMMVLGNKSDWLIENYYSPAYYDDSTEEIDGIPLYSVLEEEVTSNVGVIEDLIEILKDCWFEWGTHDHKYGEDPHFNPAITISGKLSKKWSLMEKKLRQSNRFFNQEAFETFEEVFGYLFDNHPSAFITLPAETSFYRGRIFKSEDEIADALRMPEARLGPPPSDVAPSGRMNARGISVFYGATSQVNAISEVRPPVGSFVVVSEFNLLRSVRLLDLTTLSRLGVNGISKFNPEYLHRYERSSFIKTLSRKLVMPVVPELAESNYLLTQAIADYLSITPRYELDGIMFSSAQMPFEKKEEKANNVILFHKSSSVLNADRRRLEAVVEMYQDDERGESFEPEITTSTNDFRKEFVVLSRMKPKRDVLALNLDGIVIHEVTGVVFKTAPTPVTHYQRKADAHPSDISHAKSDCTTDPENEF
ncbi:hypothetical protein RW71_04410 [Escherichia coli]|uniref:RES family NAD+ phosphorylase n=1 Tax=Escherichia coli TaxID=562 RepID=UPI000B9440AA|nr:RES family NAD+ phosphorylase [Escherichia coli]OXZ49381.1 hypothetical protein RW71_04410 [Escherichia coli]OXZ81342.1 hypothetical protein RW72_04490 [Escherichia coli]